MSFENALPSAQGITPREAITPPAVHTPGNFASSSDDTLPPPLQSSPMINEYRLQGELGRGGMGIVYKAYDQNLKRTVALKMLWAGAEADTDDLLRFRGEAEVVAQLQHPNIVQIYDIGMHEGRQYLALEYVEGWSLEKRILGQPQPPRQAAEVVEGLARAMQVAHEKGIIHRDLKPANILVSKSGVHKITDFGLAKWLDHSLGCSRTGDVMGTPSYMSPEQASGQRTIGPATDIYALGAILYELLTGRPPFRGVNVLETLEQVRLAEPAPPSRLVPKLHRDLGTICLKCLHKSPARRYATAEALADDLRRWLDGLPIEAHPVRGWERAWQWIRRRPLQAALVITSSLMIVSVVVLFVIMRERAYQEAIQDRELETTTLELEHAKALQDREAQYRKSLQEKHEASLEALDDILSLVDRGSLTKQSGLKELQLMLSKYFDNLVKREKQDNLDHNKDNKKSLAKAYTNLGRLIAKSGDKQKALGLYETASGIYDELRASSAGDDLWNLELGHVLVERGKLFAQLGKTGEAELEFKKSREYLERASRNKSEDHKSYQQLAEAWHEEGVLFSASEPARARDAYLEALKLRQRCCAKDATNRDATRDLAKSYGYLGDVQLDLGETIQADASYWDSHLLREELAKKLDDAEAQFQLARSWTNFGSHQIRVRAFDTARDFFLKALEKRKELVAANPGENEYRADLGSNYNRLAELALMKKWAGQTPRETDAQILGYLTESRKIFSDLVDKDAGTVSFQRGNAESNSLMGQFLADKEPEKAKPFLREASGTLDKLVKQTQEPVDFYNLAVVRALNIELYAPDAKPGSEEAKQRESGQMIALEKFGRAMNGKSAYRRKHIDDIKLERAFRALGKRKEFEKLLSHAQSAANPAVPSS